MGVQPEDFPILSFYCDLRQQATNFSQFCARIYWQVYKLCTEVCRMLCLLVTHLRRSDKATAPWQNLLWSRLLYIVHTGIRNYMSHLYWPNRRRCLLVRNSVYRPPPLQVSLFTFLVAVSAVFLGGGLFVRSVFSTHRLLAFESCRCHVTYTDNLQYTSSNDTAASHSAFLSKPRSGMEWNDVSSYTCCYWHFKKVGTFYNSVRYYIDQHSILQPFRSTFYYFVK